MKISFQHEQSLALKLSDATLDSIITTFMLPKFNSRLKSNRKSDYDGWMYISRHVHEWFTVGSVYHFEVIARTPKSTETIDDLENLTTAEILNWMCAEELIESGDYLIKVIQYV